MHQGRQTTLVAVAPVAQKATGALLTTEKLAASQAGEGQRREPFVCAHLPSGEVRGGVSNEADTKFLGRESLIVVYV